MGKCKYWKHCKSYDKLGVTCNKDSGGFYGINRPGGCYRDLEQHVKDSVYYKK